MIAVPGLAPTSPVTAVAPVFVTAEPPRTAKVDAATGEARSAVVDALRHPGQPLSESALAALRKLQGPSFSASTVELRAADGTVLFRNYAGQARTDRVEKQVNPLGPFQPAGEAVGAAALH